uniref:DUF3883 domain-containing protein n=1 Tax=Bosea sp. NBC_00436 TaxID=2969620 RepID=A0A9E7ZPH0_9HYPH
MAGEEWTPEEVAAVVADYFAMMAADLAGQRVNKAEHNRVLQARTGRSKGSIEFKHMNISAVLSELGLPWLRGYMPMANKQDALVGEVERHLPYANWHSAVPDARPSEKLPVGDLFVQPPERRQRDLAPSLERLIRKFDPAERDERNRNLGKAGEEFIIEVEERRLLGAGRRDLMSKVRWVSRDEGDGAGFDILSCEDDGREALIEVKTTRGARTTPFYLTRNEVAVSRERPEAWKIYRVFEFGEASRIFTRRPPLEASISLTPATWSASFQTSA